MTDLGTVAVAASPKEKFREFLATKKMRLTKERETVVEEVFSSHEHFDADHLVDRLSHRSNENRVSRSTVYRMLSMLEESGLLRRVARTNDREIWELDYGYPQHDHLICNKCGKLEEFHNEQISETLKAIADEHGFFSDGHRLEVFGVCKECRMTPARKHRKLDMV